ncbi:hypothetical protein [Kingella potus]|uniref:hypothetical protein n=1 Tax=Kingella potus TaxID=265175 RepID=UPI001FD192B2|nr:hypothetical protein [Kingella potus]UOP00211.1 hypothetical protein LVJ84_09775 [Kingella potus]
MSPKRRTRSQKTSKNPHRLARSVRRQSDARVPQYRNRHTRRKNKTRVRGCATHPTQTAELARRVCRPKRRTRPQKASKNPHRLARRVCRPKATHAFPKPRNKTRLKKQNHTPKTQTPLFRRPIIRTIPPDSQTDTP